jgi:hypothetical protein
MTIKGERLEVVQGSGNVFRDLGHKSADVEQLKAILAAEIIKAIWCRWVAKPTPHRQGVQVGGSSSWGRPSIAHRWKPLIS